MRPLKKKDTHNYSTTSLSSYSIYLSTSLLLYLATYLPLYLANKPLDTKNKFGNNRSASIIQNRIICSAIKLNLLIVHF